MSRLFAEQLNSGRHWADSSQLRLSNEISVLMHLFWGEGVFFMAVDEPINGKGQLVEIPDCRCAMGTSVSAGNTDIQATLQKPENRQQMAAIFHHQ